MPAGNSGLHVTYRFVLDRGEEHHFAVSWPRKNLSSGTSLPWTDLQYSRCPNCRIKDLPGARCPVALDVAGVVKEFNEILSYDEAYVEVDDGKRQYHKRCPAQEGLKSLMGLIMATSACPTLEFLRPMAHFHLPFSSIEESLFRTVGAYLVRQYFRIRDAKAPDLALRELSRNYSELQALNQAFAKRIRDAADHDASLNAVIHLFALSNIVGSAIDEGLPDLEPWFKIEGDGCN